MDEEELRLLLDMIGASWVVAAHLAGDLTRAEAARALGFAPDRLDAFMASARASGRAYAECAAAGADPNELLETIAWAARTARGKFDAAAGRN